MSKMSKRLRRQLGRDAANENEARMKRTRPESPGRKCNVCGTPCEIGQACPTCGEIKHV